jgi:transcriptional regulator with GAF, ATPase, and Fis domain
MKELALSPERAAQLEVVALPTAVACDDLLAMPLIEGKRLAAAAFERNYLSRVMERAGGSVSEGARLSGLDRTNFRRLLQRHGLR